MGVEILALRETIHQTYIIAFVTARICGRTDTARDVGASRTNGGTFRRSKMA